MVEQIIERNHQEAARESALGDLELNLLLEAVARFSGHDYRGFAQRTLKRRVADRLRAEDVATISGLQERVLHDPDALARFVLAMSGSGNGLFGDPGFFKHFRELVVPLLRTYAFARIWVPNCVRGEDAYAIATILHEEGLLPRSMIYATDASELAIARARLGEFDGELADEVQAAHRASGATASLAEACDLAGGAFRFKDHIKANLVFAQHSLATDGSLNEFHVIVLRGVMPQFSKALQFKVHNLLMESLVRFGFLCLGADETLRATPYERVFRLTSPEGTIYRRMR